MRLLLKFTLPVLAPVVAGLWLYASDKPRAELEAAYARPPSTFVRAAGVRLHVRDTGPRGAPAVLLLHGFGDSLHTWDAWARDLESDHRVIRLDLPGFGLTGPDPTGDYTDERSLLVIRSLLDALKVRKVVLVGNSMGGRIAWTFAAAHPDRVERLVLISPDGFASPGFAYGKKSPPPLLMRVLPYTLPEPLLRANLEGAYGDPSRLKPATLRRTRDMLLAPGVRPAILARMGQLVLKDPRPILARVRTPTLLIWGEKDGFIPIANAQDFLAALPNARLATLEGLGHVPQEETPAESLKPLRLFLAEERPSSGPKLSP